jgi:hypothetical protein
MERGILMDAVYIFAVSFAAALALLGLVVRGRKATPPPAVRDLSAWHRNVNTRWSE